MTPHYPSTHLDEGAPAAGSTGLPLLVGSVGVLRAAFAARVAHLAALAVASRGRFSMAVPGGSVASQLLPALASKSIDWSSADIFWCDERAVPPNTPASNFGAARVGWLASAEFARARLHRMAGEGDDLDQSAAAYADEMRNTLGSSPILDLIVLGVGEDGHVASLFPGDPVLHQSDRIVAAVYHAPKPPSRRLTITLPLIRASRVVCMTALGAAKRGVMMRAVFDPSVDLPVARVIRGASNAWILMESDT